jgi:hypothetical protein
MKGGKSEVACDRGHLYKVITDKNGTIERTRLTKYWTDWADDWAVDFDYFQRKKSSRPPSDQAPAAFPLRLA